jgi:hypothetical protein
VRVLQRLKSLRGIVVRNCGFPETDFFVVCDDIWIAICPFFVVVIIPLRNPHFVLEMLVQSSRLKLAFYNQFIDDFFAYLTPVASTSSV